MGHHSDSVINSFVTRVIEATAHFCNEPYEIIYKYLLNAVFEQETVNDFNSSALLFLDMYDSIVYKSTGNDTRLDYGRQKYTLPG